VALDCSNALQPFHVCRLNSGRNALQTGGGCMRLHRKSGL
jgi:hypothetical protein